MKHSGAIFAALLFVLLVAFVEFAESDRLATLGPQLGDAASSPAANPPAAVPAHPDCAQREADLAARLEAPQSCRVDADCALTRLECPFECINSVSTSLLDELVGEERTFQQQCRRCESSCPQELTKWRAACVRQRCIVLDRSNDELEEATLELINAPR